MTSPYYDSQSGQYVPMHDKIKVTAYLRWQVNVIDDIGDYSNTPWSSLVGDHARALGATGLRDAVAMILGCCSGKQRIKC